MTCLLRFTGGSLGLLDANWVSPEKQREVVLLGSAGSLRADYITQDVWFVESSSPGAAPGWEELAFIRGEGEGTATRFGLHKVEPIRAELDAFLDCIVDDTPEPVERPRRRPRARRRARDPRVAAFRALRAAARDAASRRRRDRSRVCRDPLRHPRLQRGSERRPPDGAAAAGRAQPRRARDPRGRRLDGRYGRPRARGRGRPAPRRRARTAATADSASPSTRACAPRSARPTTTTRSSRWRPTRPPT